MTVRYRNNMQRYASLAIAYHMRHAVLALLRLTFTCWHAQFVANGVALLRWQRHKEPWERYIKEQGGLPAGDGSDGTAEQLYMGNPSGVMCITLRTRLATLSCLRWKQARVLRAVSHHRDCCG